MKVTVFTAEPAQSAILDNAVTNFQRAQSALQQADSALQTCLTMGYPQFDAKTMQVSKDATGTYSILATYDEPQAMAEPDVHVPDGFETLRTAE